MTAIQILLVLPLALMCVFVSIQRVTRVSVKYILLLFLLCGLTFVIFPDAANAVSHAIGVGRGTDLILYFFAVLGIILFFFMFMKTSMINRDLTKLVRHLALSDVRWPEQSEQ